MLKEKTIGHGLVGYYIIFFIEISYFYYLFLGYDNVKSMKIKANYIVKEKLLGAMFWVIFKIKI